METKLGSQAPLGLLGLGVTLVLFSFYNIGLIELSTMILAMGIFYGGVAQLIAGAMEFKKGNAYETTVFTSYGLFWLSLVYIYWYRSGGMFETPPSNYAMAAYFFMWGLITFFMWIGSFGRNKILQLVLLTLLVLFGLLALAELTGNQALAKLAGWDGIVCGFAAVYLAVARMINEARGVHLLPFGESA